MPGNESRERIPSELSDFSIDETEIEVPPDLLERWQGVVDTLAEAVNTPAGLIMKVDPPYIEVFRSSHTEGNPYEVGDKEELTGLYCEHVIDSGDRLLVENALEEEKWKDNPDIELGMISYLGYPIKWPTGKPFGTICVLDREERDYNEKTIKLVEQFRELVETHLALLHENTRREQQTEALIRTQKELQDSEKKLRQLHQAVDRFQQCRTEEELCHAATEATQNILNFDRCSFYCVEGDQLVPIATTGDVNLDEIPLQQLGEGVTGETYREGRTIKCNDIQERNVLLSGRTDPGSFISVPIGEVGVFQAASTEKAAFEKTDVQLAEILAGHLREEIKRIRLEKELKDQAIKDPLTGLYNRRYFNETLRKEVEKSRRYGRPLAFIMVDVNRFKEVNDRYSHQIGDRVLQEVANLLRENVREADTVVRYGGDEFLIMLPETNGGVEVTANRIKQKLEEWNEKSSLLDFPLTLATGVSHCKPDQNKDVEDALKDADRRMYRDKTG